MTDAASRDVVSAPYEPVAVAAETLLLKAGGGALCIYRDGQPVLDMWAGYKDSDVGEVWQRDTMAMSWSTTKGVASTAVHMLADRGQLVYDDLVSKYWPEFGVNGKQHTTIRQVLSMEAGLYPIRTLIDDPRQMLDHDAMAAALANATPVHEPGTQNGYHAFTYGWLVGELVKRISGVSLGKFVRTEIAEPLGLDGCFIGTPDDELHRVAAFPDLVPENRFARRAAKAINPLSSLVGVSPERIASAFLPRNGNSVIPTNEFLRAEVPSVNGVFTARSLARLYAALGSDDGLDGVQLWSPATRRAATERQNKRRDQVVPLKMKWQLGYLQPFPHRKTSPRSFGFYGAFGSGAFSDPDRRLAVALTVQEAKGLPLVKLIGPILAASDHNH